MITIYHNPACGTSRNTLAAIRASGVEPEIVDYINSGWTRETLTSLFKRAGLTPRQALRQNTPPAETLLHASDNEILAAMIAHPILVQRPLVVTPKGVALCRPFSKVIPLLDASDIGPASDANERITS